MLIRRPISDRRTELSWFKFGDVAGQGGTLLEDARADNDRRPGAKGASGCEKTPEVHVDNSEKEWFWVGAR